MRRPWLQGAEIKKVQDFSGPGFSSAGLLFPHWWKREKQEKGVRCDKENLKNERTGAENSGESDAA